MGRRLSSAGKGTGHISRGHMEWRARTLFELGIETKIGINFFIKIKNGLLWSIIPYLSQNKETNLIIISS